jgi:hypothetical protein
VKNAKKIIASSTATPKMINGIIAIPIKLTRKYPKTTPKTRLKTINKADKILLTQVGVRQTLQFVVFVHLESNIFLHPFKINRG